MKQSAAKTKAALHYINYVKPMREKYVEKGLCKCGMERDDPNLKSCQHCRRERKKFNARYREKIRAMKNGGKPKLPDSEVDDDDR